MPVPICSAKEVEASPVRRYMLLFNIPGKGEEALMAGALAKGFVSAEAAAAEGPMWASFKTFEHLAQPGVATAALSWYR